MSIRFYTQAQLGPTQSLTPEGFLLCENVPLARTGTLLYAEGEIPLEAGPSKIIRVHREESDVFDPIAIASFAGKPLTDDHPPEKVTPDNWKQYAIGVVLNPHRGDGRTFDNDFLFADLLVTDAQAIGDVREGKREVSAGYDADYEQLGLGEGRQHQIVGNHVALVDKGRCGPRCAIGDHDMAATRRPAWMDRVMRAARTGDEGALVSELGKVGEMLGDVISDAETVPAPTGSPGETGHHITVNVGGHPGPARDESDPAPGTPPPAAAAAAAPAAAGGGNAEIMQAIQQVMQRLDACEQAIAMLAQGDDDGDADDPDAGAPGGAAGAAAPDASGDPDGGADDPDAGSAPSAAAAEGKEAAPGEKKKDSEDDAMYGMDRRARARDDGEGFGAAPPKPPAGRMGSAADRRAPVGDSKGLVTAYKDMLSRGEILAPGVRLPTLDAAASPRTTFDAMCAFRRQVLSAAWKSSEGMDAIKPLLGGERPNFAGMTCDAAAAVFNGASELMRQANNRTIGSARPGVNKGSDAAGTPTAATLNARNRQHYGIKQ